MTAQDGRLLPTTLPHPLLVADMGGTNCRVGIVDALGMRPRALARIQTRQAGSPEAALGMAMEGAQIRPRAAAIAVAGPLIGHAANFTNADWLIDGPALARALGFETGILVNDFEALALSLAALGPDDWRPIGREAEGLDGARLVLGPGTGFGAAALIGPPERRMVTASEAGHIELGPAREDEAAFWPQMAMRDGRHTVESVLSGAGLARIDSAMRAARGEAPRHGEGDAVHRAALAGDPSALAAVRMFGRLLARVAGDLALAAKAFGGVHVAGGIAPRLMPLFDQDEMRAAFEEKAPMTPFMRRVPFRLITCADPAERGLAALALDPGAFGMDDRLWEPAKRP